MYDIKMPKVDTEEDSVSKWTGRVSEGSVAGGSMQTRFKRIPDAHLNNETVAGIRDMKLGRIKNGKPTGAPTIRFDTGKTSGTRPHINIDPAGRPSPSNPHINTSEGTIKAAATINKTLKYAGISLTVAAVAIDAWRICSALKDDIYIRDNADKIINELEDAIEKLERQLENEISYRERQNIRDTIEHLNRVLKDVRRTKKVPVKCIKTVSSVAGGWSAGAAGGAGGAWAGAQAGTAIGLMFGPAGAAVGAPIGAIFGAISGGIAAGTAGSYSGEAIADKAFEKFVD